VRRLDAALSSPVTGVIQRADSIDLIFEIMTPSVREALCLDVRRRLQDAALVAAETASSAFGFR
jgi:hypothetical protein